MGGGGSKTTTYQQTDPWAPQQPYILDTMQQAKSLYDTKKANPGYEGDFVAGYTPTDTSAINSIRDWSTGVGQNAVNTQMGTGTDLFTRGAAGMGEVDQGLKNFAGKDWTSQHIADAGQYANNPYMQQMIDAATADAKRTFSEETMRGIDQNAALTGNMNSTRAGIAAGVAQRGLSDFTGNTSATMRGDAWNNGLKMSQADQASLLQSLLGRGDLAGNMTQMGQGAMDSAFANEAGLLGLNSSVAELTKADAQGQLDNSLAKFEYGDSRQQQALDNYYNIVGDKLWGSTSTGVENKKTQASPLSTAGSIIGGLGSLFKMCDVRTKDLIEVVGQTPEGHDLWRFTYKHDPDTEYVSPLAQDVAKTHPEAVVSVNDILLIDLTKYDWRT
jgi:hypothetical protein